MPRSLVLEDAAEALEDVTEWGLPPRRPTDVLFPAHSRAGTVSILGSRSPSRRQMPPLGIRALSLPLQGRPWPVPLSTGGDSRDKERSSSWVLWGCDTKQTPLLS